MGEDCGACKKWKEHCRKFVEHFYWGHVDLKRMHFSKFMTGDFLKYMAIPNKFTENFTGELLETVELKVPSGDSWHVECKQTKDGVVLGCGWKDFVEAQGIQGNDTLVFNYNGCSSFLVLMFEESGCEKVASHCAKKMNPKDDLWATPCCKTAMNNCNVSSSRHTEQKKPLIVDFNLRTNRRRRVSHIKEKEKFKSAYKHKEPTVHSRSKKAEKEQESSIFKRIEHPVNKDSSIKPRSQNILTVSKNAAKVNQRLSFAEAVQTDKPFFAKTMGICSAARFYMKIPVEFVKQHLRRTSAVVLQLPGSERRWNVKVSLRPVRLTTGWKKFVLDNDLKLGDICLFELVETQKEKLFTLHIKRMEA